MEPAKKRALVIHNLEKYREAKNFEQEYQVPHHQSLARQIDYLMTGSFWDADELHLAEDGCLHSFGFWFEKQGKPVGFNGGIILHGIGQETFSVELTSTPGPHWRIHT